MPEIRLKVTSTADTKALDDANKKLDTFSAGVDKMTAPAAAAAAGIGLVGAAAIREASAAEQAVGSTEQVFGKYAQNVQRMAESADQAVGLSESSYNGLASTIGGSLRAAGFATDELAGKTDAMLNAAADVSSVFGGDVTSAAGAMGAALRGEFDSLEQYGVFLNAAAVEAELARTGQDKLTGAALDAAKKQATYNLVMDQAAQYAGAFASEADTAAGAEQRAAAARENAAAQLGSAVLPLWTQFQGVLTQVANWVSQNTTVVLILAGVLGTLAALVLGTAAAIRVYTAAQAIWKAATVAGTAVQAAFNAVMAANPVTLVVIAVLALVAAIILAYQNVEWFRNLVNAAGAGIAAAWQATTAALSAAWSAVVSFMGSAWSAVVGAIRSAWSAVVSGLQAAARGLGSAWRGITSAMGSAWRSIVSGIQAAWRSAMSAAQSVARALGSAVRSVMSGIRSAITSAISVIQRIGSAFSSASGVARGALDGIIGTIRSVIGWVENALGKIGSLKNIGSGIRSFFGAADTAAAIAVPEGGAPFYMTAAQPVVPPSAWAPAGARSHDLPARTVVVNINGAIDPNRTARTVRQLLDRDARRDGSIDRWT